MAHVITDLCTKCMDCTRVCPVSCIHPAEDEPDAEKTPQVYIDPDECTDCGLCVDECPSGAIFPLEEIPEEKKQFIQINAEYYK